MLRFVVIALAIVGVVLGGWAFLAVVFSAGAVPAWVIPLAVLAVAVALLVSLVP